jgi:hypothetical protein
VPRDEVAPLSWGAATIAGGGDQANRIKSALQNENSDSARKVMTGALEVDVARDLSD